MKTNLFVNTHLQSRRK